MAMNTQLKFDLISLTSFLLLLPLNNLLVYPTNKIVLESTIIFYYLSGHSIVNIIVSHLGITFFFD